VVPVCTVLSTRKTLRDAMTEVCRLLLLRLLLRLLQCCNAAMLQCCNAAAASMLLRLLLLQCCNAAMLLLLQCCTAAAAMLLQQHQ
jgi:hypothetical protein